MKISQQRFDELLSVYMDSEETPEELALLEKCVSEDRRCAELFLDSCKIHIATCKMYARPVRLKDAPLLMHSAIVCIEASRRPRMPAGRLGWLYFKKWGALAAVMALCAGMVSAAFRSSKNNAPAADEAPMVSLEDASDLNASLRRNIQASEDGYFCGVITFNTQGGSSISLLLKKE